MSTQRYCLRWNNHQTNLLTVFDQLLHEESFVDVTLAVEGQLLRAHKMVLSACSPYFQTLFINHPDKHPIVILKDVPYCDMRSLLDFMYRGEVSVDQDRLGAFLRIAETLKIKGLTEVNENEGLYQQQPQQQPHQGGTSSNPPNLHRIQNHKTSATAHKNLVEQSHHQLNNSYGNASAAVTAAAAAAAAAASSLQQKRKRGRPRKLSGGSGDNTPAQSGCSPVDDFENRLSNAHEESIDFYETKGVGGHDDDEHGSPAIITSNSIDENNILLTAANIKQEPMAGPSKDILENHGSFGAVAAALINDHHMHQQQPNHPHFTSNSGNINNNNNSQSDYQLGDLSKFTKTGEMFDYFASLSENNNNSISSNNNSSGTESGKHTKMTAASSSGNVAAATAAAATKDVKSFLPSTGKQATAAAVRRQVRRRTNPSGSPDTAEHLTEMSVRGLNLFRYANLNDDGLYHCKECAKVDLHKTFKNKYSFQRHAFLYHEGEQRKVFPCPVCHKEFSRPDKMKNHMKMVHECFMPRDCYMPMGYAAPGHQKHNQQQLQKLQQQHQQQERRYQLQQRQLQQQLQQKQKAQQHHHQNVYQKQEQQKLQQLLMNFKKVETIAATATGIANAANVAAVAAATATTTDDDESQTLEINESQTMDTSEPAVADVKEERRAVEPEEEAEMEAAVAMAVAETVCDTEIEAATAPAANNTDIGNDADGEEEEDDDEDEDDENENDTDGHPEQLPDKGAEEDEEDDDEEVTETSTASGNQAPAFEQQSQFLLPLLENRTANNLPPPLPANFENAKI